MNISHRFFLAANDGPAVVSAPRLPMPTRSRPSRWHRFRMASVLAVSLPLMGGSSFAAAPAVSAGDYRFDEGGAAQLSGIKRVIISNFVVAFQVDAAVRKDDATRVGQMTIRGGNAKEVAAKMEWKDVDPALLQEIADTGLAALKADFKAKGIEVLDESVLAGKPDYASILAASGLTNFSDYTVMNITDDAKKANPMETERNGTVKIVGAKGLTPYNSSVFEGGAGSYVHTTSFPSKKIYYVPGHEIDLAKSLDAVVVKAWQFVNFTQLAAGVKQEGVSGGTNVHFDATAKSVVRLREGKTRLSFRLPTSTQRTRNTPALLEVKDGDVVIALAKPLLIGTQYYSFANSGETGGQKIRAGLGGTQHFNFSATLSDPAVYKADVTKGMNGILSGLLGAALGR